MTPTQRYAGLAVALVLIVAAIVAIEQPWAPKSSVPPAPAGLPASEEQYAAAPDFRGATGWVNSAPLDLVSLRGKVVLVDFWTYSCINCIHTFPHVEGFYEHYKDLGFVVVGVHTPEFRFERDINNIQAATQRYGLTYPVAVDSDYGVWDAYNNHYWPAEYLIDQYGRVRHATAGEGSYAETEQAIRQLLTEAGHAPTTGPFESGSDASGESGLTPELYAAEAEGSDRVAIGNPEGYHAGQTVSYQMPANIVRDLIFLGGTWFDNEENVTAAASDAQVEVHFRAGGGNLVADGPTGACVKVLLDGAPIPDAMKGRDVGSDGCMRLDGPRSYDFYAGAIEEHTVTLDVPAGFSLFTFDFATEGRR